MDNDSLQLHLVEVFIFPMQGEFLEFLGLLLTVCQPFQIFQAKLLA